MTKRMSTAKMTNKNEGSDIQKAFINYQDPQILTEVMANHSWLPSNGLRYAMSSWLAVRDLWRTICDRSVIMTDFFRPSQKIPKNIHDRMTRQPSCQKMTFRLPTKGRQEYAKMTFDFLNFLMLVVLWTSCVFLFSPHWKKFFKPS